MIIQHNQKIRHNNKAPEYSEVLYLFKSSVFFMWILRHIRWVPSFPAIEIHLELTAPPCIWNILTLRVVCLCTMRILHPWEIPGERYSRPQKGRRLRRPAGGTGFPSVPQDRSAPSAETSTIWIFHDADYYGIPLYTDLYFLSGNNPIELLLFLFWGLTITAKVI